MADTYIVDTDTVNAPTITEDVQAIPAPNKYLQVGAALTIFNEPDSGKVIRIKRFAVSGMTRSFNGNTAFDYVTLYRTTAQNANLQKIVPSKMDSTAGDLPDQVLISKHATTTLSGNAFRKVWGGTFSSITATLMSLRPGRGGMGRHDQTNLFQQRDSVSQPLVLREGEGVTVQWEPGGSNTEGMQFPPPFHVVLTIDVGGSTYIVTKTVQPMINMGMVSVFNGSGSGVVLNIRSIEAYPTTDETRAPGMTPTGLRLETISQASLDGEAVSVAKSDSTAAALPSGIRVLKNNGTVQLIGDSVFKGDVGYYEDGPIRRTAGNGDAQGLDPAGSVGMVARLGTLYKQNDAMDPSRAYQGSELTIRPGTGIALFRYQPLSAFSSLIYDLATPFAVNLVFTVADNSGVVTKTITKTSDARVLVTQSKTKLSDARVLKVQSLTKTSDARILKVQSIAKTSDAAIKKTLSLTKLSDARIRLTQSLTKLSDARVLKVQSLTKTSDTRIRGTVALTKLSDARVRLTQSVSKLSDARIRKTQTLSKTSDARVRGTVALTKLSDARVRLTQALSKTSDARVRATVLISRLSDARILIVGTTSKTSNAAIKSVVALMKTSDTAIRNEVRVLVLSDARVLVGRSLTLTSDARIGPPLILDLAVELCRVLDGAVEICTLLQGKVDIITQLDLGVEIARNVEGRVAV